MIDRGGVAAHANLVLGRALQRDSLEAEHCRRPLGPRNDGLTLMMLTRHDQAPLERAPRGAALRLVGEPRVGSTDCELSCKTP
jgi:hypothetical protein